MAKLVTDWQFTRDRVDAMPWDQWLNGQAWELTQGEDFYHTDVEHFLHVARERGYNSGMRIRTQRTGERTVIIKATKGLPPHRMSRNGNKAQKRKQKS